MDPTTIALARERVAQERAALRDLSHGYPANHFAWRYVAQRARQMGARSLVEVGVGSGNGVAHVVAAGMEFGGLDRDAECVEKTRAELRGLDLAEQAVIEADVHASDVMERLPGAGSFDLLMGLGIMPHVDDPDASVAAMARLVRSGGEMFLEFRNSLFALVTFNRLTHDFLASDVFVGEPNPLRERTSMFIADHVVMSTPPEGSSALTSSYANPFAISAWFDSFGCPNVRVVPFHFHAAPPLLEAEDPQGFRDASLTLEDDTSGWRGLLLCSAFLAQVPVP